MFGLFRKKWTMDEVAQAFPLWEKSVTVGLATQVDAELSARGISNEVSRRIAAQSVNYIVGEDWKAVVSNAPPEIKSVVEARMSEIEPAIHALLANDKSSREVLVYFLRLKTVFLAACYGFDVWAQNPMQDRISQTLSMYGEEFPEEADPGKFSAMVLNFQRRIFPQKHA